MRLRPRNSQERFTTMGFPFQCTATMNKVNKVSSLYIHMVLHCKEQPKQSAASSQNDAHLGTVNVLRALKSAEMEFLNGIFSLGFRV
jgi:hypothetical protein